MIGFILNEWDHDECDDINFDGDLNIFDVMVLLDIIFSER